MVYAPDRGRRGHAHRNFAGLPSFARLHPNAVGRREIILRPRESRHLGRRRRLLMVGAAHRTAGRLRSIAPTLHPISLLRSISKTACAVSCLNVSRSLGKKNLFAIVSWSAKASAT